MISLELPGRVRSWTAPGSVALALALGAAGGAVVATVGPLYALGGLAAAAAALAVASNVRLALVAFVAVATLVPFGVVPVSIGGVRPTFIDLVLTLLLVTWLARLLTRQDRTVVTTAVDLPLIAFMTVCIAAFLLGTSYSSSAEVLRQFVKLLNSMLFFFSITQLLRDRRGLEDLVRALTIGGIAASGVGVILYHLPPGTAAGLLRSLRPLGYPTGDVLRYVEDAGVRTETLRAIGTSIDPNVFGALLLITGILAAGKALEASGTSRIAWGSGLALAVYGLLVSLSRGSWLGFGAGIVVLGAIRYRRVFLMLPIVALAVAVVLAGQIARYAEHFLKAVYARDQATGMRLGEYKDALNLIQQHPWLGVGFGGTPSRDLYLGVSSTYLQVAEQTGLIGLALYLLAIGSALVVGVRAVRHGSEAARPLGVALLGALVGVLVAALVDKHFFELRYQHVAALFWMLCAMLVLCARFATRDNGAKTVR